VTLTAPAPSLTIDRLGPHHGARITGIDLVSADDGVLAAVRAALVEHKVLFFSGQVLDPDSQVLLGRRLGELTPSHPVVKGIDEDHPEIYALDAADNGFADVWHTDVTFVRRPPLGSALSALVRDLADRLTAVHDGNREFGYYLAQRGGNAWDGAEYRRLEPVEHPVVRVHPETGRRSLFVNPGFTSHIAGVSDAESRGLLDLFYAHLTKPEHIVRHRWTAGDVAMWDNRSTLHYANRDYGDFRRIMHRVTWRGEEPVGP
jgi:alpha-ketoglutarate-dependent taurine dioxygenase